MDSIINLSAAGLHAGGRLSLMKCIFLTFVPAGLHPNVALPHLHSFLRLHTSLRIFLILRR